ncbi:hypothetical protein J3Q64DRAFT_1664877, partial [Phycomyces blakesleeanus]
MYTPPTKLVLDPALEDSMMTKIEAPWQIRVLGLPGKGAKSRVETQIKICIQLVNTAGDLATHWPSLHLPEHLVAKDKLKRKHPKHTEDRSTLSESDVLRLEAAVVCDSHEDKEIIMCASCVHRERKRLKRKRDNKAARAANKEGGAAKLAALFANDLPDLNDEEVMNLERRKILLFNCSETIDFRGGEATLPTRITCYCRHHSEKVGFRVVFTVKDYHNHVIATGRSPPIMITDDHKSSKIQPTTGTTISTATNSTTSTRKRLRTDLESSPAEENPKRKFAAGGDAKSNVTLPRLHRLIPSEGPIYGGAEVTVLGSNFYEGLTCLFGENPAVPTHCWSPNTLLCILPPAPTAGPVVVSFKEHPLMLEGQDVVLFTYFDESDRALMELALQVVGLKTMGKVEDARQIAMRIVQGDTSDNQQRKNSSTPQPQQQQQQYHQQYPQERTFAAVCQQWSSEKISLTNCHEHTLLHLAALCGYSRLVRVLIRLGVDVDRVDRNGFTALHFASWTGKQDIVHTLL